MVPDKDNLDDEPKRPSKKPVLESMANLDVRILLRNGMLSSGVEGDLHFRTTAGELAYHVGVAVAEDDLTASFRDTLDGRMQRQKILLTKVQCHFGGHKKLLVCSSCGERRVALYLRGMRFRCRVCNESRYWSQCHREPIRKSERARQIRKRLGGTGSLAVPFPQKPKGMHWTTYLSALDDCERAEKIWLRYLAGGYCKRQGVC